MRLQGYMVTICHEIEEGKEVYTTYPTVAANSLTMAVAIGERYALQDATIGIIKSIKAEILK